jgi:hypothetical protein
LVWYKEDGSEHYRDNFKNGEWIYEDELNEPTPIDGKEVPSPKVENTELSSAESPPFNGDAIRTYEDGRKQSKARYRDGRLNGPWICWYRNGRIRSQGHWLDGKLEGYSTWWYENGLKQQQCHHRDGKLVSAVVWKPDGDKCPCSKVTDGEGVLVWYKEDGTEYFRKTYAGNK